MTPDRISFAVPGDLSTLTGGYIYDRRVMQELRLQGWTVDHIALPAAFPDPSPQDMVQALRQLQEVPADQLLVVDGLALGALDPAGLTQIPAPLIALVHHPLAKESGLSPARSKALFETERANLSRASKVLVPSPHTGAILTSEYDVPADKIVIATPGIDQPDRNTEPSVLPLILSVGIQLPRKGHDVLLRALSEITDLNWRAMIVGAALDSDYALLLQELRASLGLRDRVTLPGQVGQAELAGLYRKATIFALATRYEGYGIVFDEALVHGLPIVSCHAGAVADTVPEGAGRLVPPDEPVLFAAALRELLCDTTTRQKCATASQLAGAQRPGWGDTAEIIANALAKSRTEGVK
ncbi:MAG: glycosyltransferase family 4 protein [Pseudomonadota bacterium]